MAYIPEQPITFGAFREQAVSLKRARAELNFAYNVNASFAETVTASGGTVTASNGRARMDPTTANGGRAKVMSRRRLNYIPGTGATVRFTSVWGTPDANNRQIAGYGDDNNGLFFGYNGTVFGLLRRAASVDNWIAQTAWNLDKADGTGQLPAIDFSGGFGNIFQITYQWLGYGAITYAVEHPTLGRFIDVHRIMYANTSAEVSFRNPSLPLMAESFNVGGASSAASIMFTPSMGAYTDFPGTNLGPVQSSRNSKNFGTGAITNLFTMRNDSTFQGIANQVEISLLYFAGSQDANQLADFRLVRNATLAGVPVYNPISANESVVSVDVAGTTVSGGTEILSRAVGGDAGFDIILESLDLALEPGETLTVAAEKLAGAAANHAGSLTWRENF